MDEAGVKGPLRTCVGCRKTRAASELVRVVAGPAGGLLVGSSLPGRGAWLCRGSERCVQLAIERRSFERALHRVFDPAALVALQGELGSNTS